MAVSILLDNLVIASLLLLALVIPSQHERLGEEHDRDGDEGNQKQHALHCWLCGVHLLRSRY